MMVETVLEGRRRVPNADIGRSMIPLPWMFRWSGEVRVGVADVS